MKKFILSATLALACFSANAQAKNEVIKNDDDKNPKAKAKVVKAESPGYCTMSSYVGLSCPDGPTVVGATRSARTCQLAQLLADVALWGATC